LTVAIEDAPRLGEGLYTFPQAARILRSRDRQLTPQKLRYWLNAGLSPATYEADGQPLLTFLDLISLEVVRRFTGAGWAPQGVRRVEDELRAEFGHLERPFAYQIFYTDGQSLWAKKALEDNQVTELLGKKADRQHKPLAWSSAVATFAEEIRFDGPKQVASAWELSPWIEIDPTIQFGTPVVRGTRVPVSTVVANLEVGAPGEVADWYGLTLPEVQGARDYDALV
jgi:uncharacterized protein (DUF433 family)/DNA-binding transcriptional MerR regulator